jgi:hypothetical protein
MNSIRCCSLSMARWVLLVVATVMAFLGWTGQCLSAEVIKKIEKTYKPPTPTHIPAPKPPPDGFRLPSPWQKPADKSYTELADEHYPHPHPHHFDACRDPLAPYRPCSCEPDPALCIRLRTYILQPQPLLVPFESAAQRRPDSKGNNP